MGYAIVSDTMVIEAQALQTQTTNYKPTGKVITLTRAFQFINGQTLNLYTDSKQAPHILLSHAAIWKRHWLPTTKDKSITNSDEIVALQGASFFPTAIIA